MHPPTVLGIFHVFKERTSSFTGYARAIFPNTFHLYLAYQGNEEPWLAPTRTQTAARGSFVRPAAPSSNDSNLSPWPGPGV
jgi:hypothetical protein